MRLLATLAVLLSVWTGSITYYRTGLMEEVYRNRLAWGHVKPCPRCVGMLAMLDREHVGKIAYITRPGHAPEGLFLTIDCASQKDYERLKRRGLVAEVDYQTALRWEMRGPIKGVTVSFYGKVNNERRDLEAHSRLRGMVLSE